MWGQNTGYIGDDFVPYLCFFAFGLAIRAIYDGSRLGILAAVVAVASFIINSFVGLPTPSLPLSSSNFAGYAACFAIFVGVLHFARGRHSERLG